MTKQKITITEDSFSAWEFDMSLGKLRAKVDDLISTYGPDAELDWDPDNWNQYDDNPSPVFRIHTTREETDEEYTARCDRETRNANEHLAREKAEFERLQKKFGKKNK